MPAGVHETQINVPIEEVWDFVSSINNWAPLVPGYITHDLINENESTWEFKGDLGFMKKTVKLKVDITEWGEPTLVTFKLTGTSDNFKGGGFFKAEKIDDNSTKMVGSLDISAGGAMGPMVNAILKSFVPKTAEELTIAVAEEIAKVKA
ncbi:SRPBCC family protein [Sporosarcina oncorhynchi]|uniref:SRPBCC family protein n=1 Tax=Sporosarcina oncorhynchi TaxID=3056444 RepID=A0ABZ0L383_9BACL|nr:SRPBCC family protein [Sporosarcina sp. T2O-4]WOV86925.1 SRPBCC family protein [Sporosarcina sp. T2O-4]